MAYLGRYAGANEPILRWFPRAIFYASQTPFLQNALRIPIIHRALNDENLIKIGSASTLFVYCIIIRVRVMYDILLQWTRAVQSMQSSSNVGARVL